MDLLWPQCTLRVGVKSYLCLQQGGEPGREQAALPESIPKSKDQVRTSHLPLQTCPASPGLLFCQPAPAVRAPAHPSSYLYACLEAQISALLETGTRKSWL